MRKTVTLKDETKVVIREMRPNDVEASLAFFTALPEDDRAYLRRDVTQREVVERRMRETHAGGVLRLVALVDDGIVADGALELSGEEWKKHLGEIRLIVDRGYRRKGLGILMARELYRLAAAAQVEEIVVKMMRPQKAARAIFRKLGFREETVLPDYLKDLAGHKQDLVLMRCDLASLWQELEDYLVTSDWERAR